MPGRLSRERQSFPTRNYPYRLRSMEEMMAPAAFALPDANTLYRRVLGIDEEHRAMTADELALLDDPLGRLLRSGKPFPLSLRELLQALDAAGEVPDQLVFLVADGGHVPWSEETDDLQRAFRFVVARRSGVDFRLLISASTLMESAEDHAFLQVIGWDSTHEVFHYYERLFGTFFWAGMSPHALEPASRGKGPFDSHVNGSLVMKELRAPWIHWHAPLAGINREAFAPDDPLVDDPLFLQRVTAERLETEIVRPAIRRWNESRVRKAIDDDGVWRNAVRFVRQVITDTTVNLATTDIASHLIADQTSIPLPLSFFLNRDVLFDTLGLEPDEPEVARIAILGAHYRECLQRYGVHRSDGAIRIEGDSHFAFLVPEAAFEDTQLADAMLNAELLTHRFLACLSMVDFANPVFSPRRAALLRYVPDEVEGSGEVLAECFVAAVTAANAAPDSPEQEFLANWNTEDYENAFRERITEYFRALQNGMNDANVVDGWFRLVEHRRRMFRGFKLAEFKLTTPVTNIPEHAPALRMTINGVAEEMP